ncbi:MAG: helix-turn-helix transcriptional regulator, partial [Candidatus Dormibacteraceae bacterium]
MKQSKSRLLPNIQLREARRRRGWSQEDEAQALQELAIAEGYPALGIDGNTISRWERGKQQPQAHHAFLLSKLHQKLPAELGVRGREGPLREGLTSAPSGSLVVSRASGRHGSNSPVAALSALDTSARFDPDHWERLFRAIGNPRVVDESLIESCETQTRALFELALAIPAAHLSPHVTLHLDNLTDILSSTAASGLRHRLVVTTGEAAMLAGWLAWDRGDAANSQRLYRVAVEVARETKDSDILACCLGSMSYVPSRAGEHGQAIDQLKQALDQAKLNSSTVTYAWLEARLAEELAGLGDDGSLSLIESNQARFRALEWGKERVWTNFLTPTRVANFQVNAYLALGRYEEVEPLAISARQSVEYASLRPVVLADAATLRLHQGNYEEGVEL